jgi:hypothetical protein
MFRRRPKVDYFQRMLDEIDFTRVDAAGFVASLPTVVRAQLASEARSAFDRDPGAGSDGRDSAAFAAEDLAVLERWFSLAPAPEDEGRFGAAFNGFLAARQRATRTL